MSRQLPELKATLVQAGWSQVCHSGCITNCFLTTDMPIMSDLRLDLNGWELNNGRKSVCSIYCT